MRALAAALGLLALVIACGPAAAQTAQQCGDAQKPWVVAELLFGRTGVNARSWTRFLATEITPRFPDGLTVIDGRGQWRNPATKRILRQRSTLVMIAMPPSADNDARLQQIVEAYKHRFRQQSVGLIVRPACVSFYGPHLLTLAGARGTAQTRFQTPQDHAAIG